VDLIQLTMTTSTLLKMIHL